MHQKCFRIYIYINIYLKFTHIFHMHLFKYEWLKNANSSKVIITVFKKNHMLPCNQYAYFWSNAKLVRTKIREMAEMIIFSNCDASNVADQTKCVERYFDANFYRSLIDWTRLNGTFYHLKMYSSSLCTFAALAKIGKI